ncbi:hypothetical protein DPMN_018518 [Dreissena polymorpha]|uniref:NADH dehydrogenase subunit 6 n=1 Tax=Dreissena polymorpha TaxID=45954 RepID=A0A9D4S998_DREPO|nr:hypothetical protein DPMN_018518 [Dreissena polymorpha]
MDVLCYVFTAKLLLPFCVSMDIFCSGCSQHSHYFLSVSACIYLALGVHNQFITAFLCQNGCIVLWVFTAYSYCLSVSAWKYLVLGFHSIVITAFLCQHGYILLWVFTTKSLLPFCVSMDVSRSGYSQPSHYCLSVSAWIYLALGVHNIVITAFLC